MLKKLLKSHQFIKWLAIVAACFLIVFGSVSLYLNIWVKPILDRQIKELVAKGTANLYSIHFTGISVNCLTGDAKLMNVKLLPDTNILKSLILAKKAPNNIYYIELKKLSIKNVHPFRVYSKKRLNIDEVEILRPKITMINKQYVFNEDKPPRPQSSPFDFVSRYLKEVRIETINFKDASFKYIDQNHEKPIIDSLSRLNITLKDWLIDENSAQDTTRFYLLKEVELQLNNYTYATADSLYQVKASELNFTGSTGNLSIKRLALVPRYSEMDFAKANGTAKDRFQVQFNHVNLKGIDFLLFLKKQELHAQEMNIRDGDFSVFSNNEIKGIKTDKTGHYPHQLLQELESKITIKKLDLHNINISYAAYDPDSKQKGKITFAQTSGTILNISNVAKEVKKQPFMEAHLKTLMMGQGKLHARFNFNLLAKDGAFSYSGVLHGLNGSTLNSITKPLGMVHIKSGVVKKLSFNVRANDQKAIGTMEFQYNDLAIAVLKREKGSQWLKRQGLLSFLANNLMLNPDNPNALGVLTHANIAYERKPHHSFFSFVWRSLFQGIRYSVGITPHKEAALKLKLEKFERIKIEREQRKEKREQRRENRKERR
jgi:hypothetical protein